MASSLDPGAPSGDAADAVTRTLDDALGPPPQLLDSAAGRRQREDIRARLFGTALEPELIGRYEVEGRLGAGAIGVVYRARDPRLGREVAIKVLRERTSDAARLRREAQTLARLSDPNVVAIYEVGEHDGCVFVAMELIRGQTLRVWQRDRPWTEVLGAYLEAGRGLAAAHRAGIVHRDFKPDNVMIDAGVGDRGHPRVRVLDFGLARGDEATGEAEVGIAADPRRLATTLTGTGTTLGTPAYMPPEQLRSATVDARADQFAFCVSVFEGCHGVRPFAGDSAAELAEAIVAGRVRPSAREHGVPNRVRRVLLRGLAPRPEQRFDDMDALLRALARARARPARLLALVALVAALAGLLSYLRGADNDVCAHAGDAIADSWAPTRARALLARARAEGADPQPWRTRIGELDQRAAEWREEAAALCRDPHADDAPIRRRCLDDVRTAIDHADAGLERALDRGAPRPDDVGVLGLFECATRRAQGLLPATISADRLPELHEVRAALDLAIEAGAAGEYGSGRIHLHRALPGARALGDPSLLAEALIISAAIREHEVELELGERELTEAYDVAHAAGADRLALRAATDAISLVGDRQRRRDEGERWARLADALTEQLPADDESRMRLWINRGLMRVTHGEQALAREDFERAEEFYVSRHGDAHAGLLPVLGNLAHLESLERRHDAALVLLDRTIAIHEREYGELHPGLVATLGNRALVLLALARYDDALASLARARAICLHAGLELQQASVDNIFADVYFEMGRFEDARAMAASGLARQEHVHDADHPLLRIGRLRLADILVAQGDDAAAAPLLLDVVARGEAKDRDDESAAFARAQLVGIAVREENFARATRELARALDDGGQYPCAAALAIAQAAAVPTEATGDRSRGEAPLVEALRSFVAGDFLCSGLVAAELELALARALARAGAAPGAVREIADLAVARWRARGRDWHARADATERWLDGLARARRPARSRARLP